MICVRCGKRSTFPRSGGVEDKRCEHCGEAIAFAPRAGDPVNDKVFARALGRISAEDKLRFTEDQLYYELRRILGPLARSTFAELWARWQAVHGPHPGLVVPWPAHGEVTPLREADIGDYSFERVVISDHAWIVDFLLANNFHFETNSAVLAIEGHPPERFELVREMLRQNPEVVVIAIHDASLEGAGMAQRLVTEDGWFRDHGYVFDVGLSPAHRELYEGLWSLREGAEELEGVDPLELPEAEWLARYVLDFAVVRPEKIMRRLFRASRHHRDLLTKGDGLRVGEAYRDDVLLGPGWRKRIATGEERQL